MSDVQTVVPIPDLEPADLPIAGTDLVIIGQGGLAKRSTVDDVFGAGVPNPMPAVDGSAVQVTATGSTTAIDLADRAAQVISVKDYGAKGDWRSLTGTISYVGSLFTATGAAFTIADIGKWIVVPGGGAAAIPVLRQVVAVGPDGTQAVLNAAATSSFVGATLQLNTRQLSPTEITPNTAGTGYHVGNVLTLSSGTFSRAATVQVTMTKAISGTVVNAGTLGPVGTAVLTGTTGYGKRVQFTATVDATGSIASGLTLLTAGSMWQDVADATAEPLTAYPVSLHTTATFSMGSTSVVVANPVGMRVGNRIGATGIPNGTYITVISGSTLTISNPTIIAGASVDCVVTNNSTPIYTTATYTADATTVVVASAAGLKVGHAVGGFGIPGSGDPTSATSTRITAISGTSITLSAAVTASATAVTFAAYPMLTGAVASVVYGVAACCFGDAGLYSAAPTFPTATTTTGGGTGCTITTFTTSLAAPIFTDDTAAINAAAAVCRALVAARNYTSGVPVVLDLPFATYGCLSPINFSGIVSRGFKINCNGSQIYSVAAGGIAVDFTASRWYTVEGPFHITGDPYFSPRIGSSHAQVGTASTSPVTIHGPYVVDGTFTLCCVYLMGTESSTLGDFLLYNNYTALASYCLVCDGYNHFAVSSTFIPQTLPADFGVSFISLSLPNVSAIHKGAGSPYWFGKVNGLYARGYGASYGPPGAVFLLGTNVSGSPSSFINLDVHFETLMMQDVFFLTSEIFFSLHGLIYKDETSHAQNSLIAVDTQGTFGNACVALPLFDTVIDVNALQTNTVVFDSPQVIFYQGSVTLANVSTTRHWNDPNFFQGTLALERVVTSYIKSINVTTLSVNTDAAVAGAFGVQGDITTGTRLLVRPGESATVIIGGDGNGDISIGVNGTTAEPSSGTPYVQWYGPGNTGDYDARLISDAAGELHLTTAGSAVSAYFRIGGQVSSLAQNEPYSRSSAVTNGDTLTLTASAGPPKHVPGPVMVAVSGSIATATIVLPSETICDNGYVQRIACTGTIGTLTLVSPGGFTIFGGPTSLSPTTAGTLRLDKSGSPFAWRP